MTVLLYGYPEVPYVAKVMWALAAKQIAYEHDPIFPFTDRERMDAINPKTSKVPVIAIDGERTIESAAICELLDKKYPGTPLLFPQTSELNAQAREIDAWADKELGSRIGFPLLLPTVLIPRYMPAKESPSAEKMDASKAEVHAVFATLESKIAEWVGANKFLAGNDVSIADITMIGWIRCAEVCGVNTDASRTPLLSAWMDRVRAVPFVAAFETKYYDIPGIKAAMEKLS
jgi:glutathione S-transferase